MREIKFRAWLKNKEKMVEVDTIDFTGEYILYKGQTDEQVFRFKDIELMQYTGLKDKNGKEIYEGDIVKSYDCDDNVCIDIVIYNPHCQAFVIESIQDWGNAWGIESVSTIYECADVEYNLNKDCIPYTNDFEVIGNIYENKDLLEE